MDNSFKNFRFLSILLFCVSLTAELFSQHIIITGNNDSIPCKTYSVLEMNVELRIDSLNILVLDKDSIREIISSPKKQPISISTSNIDTLPNAIVLHQDVGSTIELREKDFYNLFPYIPNDKFKSARYIRLNNNSILLEITYINGEKKTCPYENESFYRDQTQVNDIYLILPEEERLVSTNPSKYIYLSIFNVATDKTVRIKEGQKFYFKEKQNNNIAEDLNVIIDYGLSVATLIKIIDDNPPSILVDVSGVERNVLLDNIILIRKDQLSIIHDLASESQIQIKYRK